ncbi:hypothetical protein EVAR_17161_1 [Eumeta japonica]|uniref:Uncharacterized protein n=1 Tax=Eumeta variegata TaxID=151549 RepID=A0A4C1U9R7_EUMVA|nr:hypothetical protein EVAR_17161_1 [Eumeta japonica]
MIKIESIYGVAFFQLLLGLHGESHIDCQLKFYGLFSYLVSEGSRGAEGAYDSVVVSTARPPLPRRGYPPPDGCRSSVRERAPPF